MRDLIILTGPRGSGKTSLCARWISSAKANGLDPAGLLSPAVFHQGEKIGIDLLNVATGEQRPLARQCLQTSQGIRLGVWCFKVTTLDWGNQILRTVKDQGLIFLDEMGPLEFEKGTGLVAGFELIDKKVFDQAVVVIRPELLRQAQDRWPEARVLDVSAVESEIPFPERGIV